jgi:hypothetical protein
MPGISDLHDLCLEYLDACDAALAETDAGSLTRTYVSPGPPAFDCEQLTVHTTGPAQADTLPLIPPLAPGLKPRLQGRVYLASLVATVIRCVPVLEQQGQTQLLPDPAAMEAAAKTLNEDMWSIWNHVGHLVKENLLFADNGHRREVFFEPAIPILTSGGFGGWEILLRVQIGGYSSPN